MFSADKDTESWYAVTVSCSGSQIEWLFNMTPLKSHFAKSVHAPPQSWTNRKLIMIIAIKAIIYKIKAYFYYPTYKDVFI